MTTIYTSDRRNNKDTLTKIPIRMNWLDWMKVIGMYLIVYGHYTSYGYEFVYTFNVPLFFIISGFLTKRETKFSIFIKKSFFNLILPMSIMVILVQIRIIIAKIINSTFEYSIITNAFTGTIIGNQKVLGPCWFIYTLFVLKTIHQFTPPVKIIYI